MATSIISGSRKTLNMKVHKFIITTSFILISAFPLLGQAPSWVAGTPVVVSTGPLTITTNYGINMAGTVYIAVLNYNSPVIDPATIKLYTTLPIPTGALVASAIIPVNGGNIGVSLQSILSVLAANTTHSVWLVAESSGGVLQAVGTKLLATTKPCPDINLFTFFGNSGTCVNLGAIGMFQAAPLGAMPTGVLKGTRWTIDWGDGTAVWQYISTADNDIPGVQLHPYTNLTTCNYVGTWTVDNRCGKFTNGSTVFVVHGRDIPTDGDGVLRMQEPTTPSPDIVFLCEGKQHKIFVQDISTWNCQNPVVPAPLVAKPNIDPRTIQFIYGESPTGVVGANNTITGNVLIGGVNIANAANGYEGTVIKDIPVPNPQTLSEEITIPATAVVGQRFFVYLKNWNKCNPYTGDPSIDYEYQQFIIEIIDAPPAPIVVTPKNYCFGAVPATISATPNLVGNTINWYSDVTLTTLLFTGQNYTHGQTGPGTYNYWVTETSGANGCEGPSAQITMNIREDLTRPGPITGPAQVCTNQAGIIYSVVANPPVMPIGGATEYFWSVPADWTITAGQGTRQITVTSGNVAGNQTISAVTRYTTAPQCPTNTRSITTNLNPVATINSAATKTVCDITPLAYTATSATPGCSFAWTRAAVAGISNPAGGGATALINESLDNTTTAAVNVIYVITPTINGCVGTPFNLTVTVNPTAVITSAATKNICDVTPLAYTSTSSTAGATFAWTRAVVAGISNGAGAGATALINESLNNTITSDVNVTYVITPSFGGCPGTPFNLVATVRPTAVITSAATLTICDNAATGYTITSSTAGTTFAWTRAAVAGIANPAGGGAGASINENLDNTTTGSVNVTYVITPTYAGCTGTVFNLVVTVRPTAVITSAATKTVCDVTPLAYTSTSSTAGATFAWTRAVVAGISNGAGAGATALINESLDNTTTAPVNVTYVITPSSGGCPGTSFNLVVTVNPTAVITSAATKTVCDVTALNYTATSSTAGATFGWTRAAVAGIANPANSGLTNFINESLDNTTTGSVNVTYIITASYGGCPGTAFNLVVTVRPTATINSAATRTVCDVTPLAYTATSATAGATFAWTRAVVAGISNGAGAGATALINESLDNTTTAPVNATYIITPSANGCPGTPFNLVVTVNPTAVITSAATRTVCSNSPLAYTATSSTAGATFAWTRAVVAGISNPAGAGATALINESLINTTGADVNTIYVITPSYGGCTGTPFNLTVTVHPQFPQAQLHDNNSICNNTATNFNIILTGGTSPYTINYTRNGTAQGPLNNYISGTNVSTGVLTTGSYVYALTSVTDAFGCQVQSLGTSITITVGAALASATFTTSGDACLGASSTMQSVITGGAPPYTLTITGYAGSPVAGYTSGTNINLGALALGPHTYILTGVSDACGNNLGAGLPISRTININPIPNAAATVNNTPSICDNGTTDIVFHADVANSDFIYTVSNFPAVTWVVGKTPVGGTQVNGENISLAQNLSHTSSFSTTVTYSITPRGPGATACLGALITRTVVVNPRPLLSSSLTPPAICSNTAFSYTPTSATAGTTFNWSRATVAGITPVGPTAGTNNPNETLVNTTANPIVVTYAYTLAANGCSNVQNVTVTVNPSPTLTSSLTPPAICSNTAFSYAPASATAGTTFNWSRATVAGITPVGPTSGTNNPNETLVNTTANPIVVTYAYTLAANGCSNVQNVTVTVNPSPTLSSSLTPPAICSNTAFSYAPTSATAGTTFNWSRATVAGITPVGPTSGTNNPNETLVNTTANPIVVTYAYTLAANGCTRVQNVTVTVNPSPTLTSSLTPPAICSNTAFSYAPTSATAGTTFNWSRATVAGITPVGPTSGTNNPNETLVNTTANPIVVTYAYTLAANGCSNVQNVTVTVNPSPTLTSSLTPPAICSNTAFSYAPTSATAGTTFNWSRATVAGITPVGPTSGTNNPNETLVNTTANPIVVTYAYTLAANGCTSVQNVTVTVNPSPTLTSSLTPPAICSNTAFSYAPTSATAGTTFNWSRATVAGITPVGPTSGTNNPNETLVNTTANPIVVTYAYTLAANGCSNVQNVTVTVNPSPTLTSSLTPPAICSNTAFSYAPASATAGTTFNWSRATVAGITPVGPTSGTNNPNETLVNTTANPIVVTYAYTLAANGCSNVQNVTVTVNPSPTLPAYSHRLQYAAIQPSVMLRRVQLQERHLTGAGQQ